MQAFYGNLYLNYKSNIFTLFAYHLSTIAHVSNKISYENNPDEFFDKLVAAELRLIARSYANITLGIFMGAAFGTGLICYFLLPSIWKGVAFILGFLALLSSSTFLLQRYGIAPIRLFLHSTLFSTTLGGVLLTSFVAPEEQSYYFLTLSIVYLALSLSSTWEPHNGIYQALVAFVLMYLNFRWHTRVEVSTFLANGGLLFATMTVVASFLNKLRYDLLKRELSARIIMGHAQRKLYLQQKEINEKNERIIEKERNLSAILENNDIGIWLINERFELIEYNSLFAQSSYGLFGTKVQRGEVIFRLEGFEQISERWAERYRKVLQEKQTLRYIDQHQTAKGKLFLETSLYPIFSEESKPIGISVFSKNINEQKRAEEIIKLSEQRLRGIIESTQDIVFALDTEYRYLTFNQNHLATMKGIYGIAPAIGKSILECMNVHNDAQKAKRDIDRALAGEQYTIEQMYGNEALFRTYFEASYNPIYDDDNLIIGVAVFVRDITQRRRAEDKLKENEQMLASINRNIQEGIYRSSPTKGLLYINQAFAEMFGCKNPEEMYRLSPESFYADQGYRQKLIERLTQEGSCANEETLFRRKDGSTFWGLESSLATYLDNGEIVFDGAIRDISMVKETQQMLEVQNEELKKINSELDRFVYSASHDLKAPLASVLGLINIARLSENQEEISQYLQLMETSVRKLDNFIREIIAYSRNSRLEPSQDLIHFEQILEEAYENVKYLENYERLDRRLSIEGDVPFYTDSKRLLIVFNNLISNAIIYQNTLIEQSFIEIKVCLQAKQAEIHFTDNGQGIATEHLANIFKMFYRASQDSKGSGLGLYIVKETIDKLGGNIKVSSEYGEGTHFHLVLPNLQAPAN